MPLPLYRIAVLPILTGLLGGCGVPGLPAQATVTMIDRKCEIIVTTDRDVDDPRGGDHKIRAREMDHKTDDCKSVDEWQEVRKKRTKDVKGTAIVHVDYQAPQDGRARRGTLTFTGRDDEFYKLNAGDTIPILIAKDDPERIRKA